MKNTLYIVIPCFNEEEALPQSAPVLQSKLTSLIAGGKISPRSKILLVDDGSRDRTWELIEQLAASTDAFLGMKLSHNRGTQNAIHAGLMAAARYADMAVTTDVDLQDDIDAIDLMVERYLDGCDVVYGVRSKRERDTFMKRFTAESYYKLLSCLGCDVVFNHSDFRLLSRRVIDALARYGERDLFLRGVVPMIGFKTATVEYERYARVAGETKYTFKSLLSLAANGATSLSLRPLRLVLQLGIFTLIVAALFFAFALVRHFMGYSILGYKLTVLVILAVGGLNLTGLGVVGEYAGRAYMEAKKRPRYFIESAAGFDPDMTLESAERGDDGAQ
jgi:glycosyltransferase involved in cell wall biosynthesis